MSESSVGRSRRLSEVPNSISAIFNPKKHRRGSVLETPSVVITTESKFDTVDFARSVTFDPSLTPNNNAGMVSGESSKSSVPLLAELQSGSSSGGGHFHNDSSSSLVHQGSLDQGGGLLRVRERDVESGNNNNNQTNLKPIARTFTTLRRALFSKTARKLCCGLFLSLLVGSAWTIFIQCLKRAYLTTELFSSAFDSQNSEDSSSWPTQLKTHPFFSFMEISSSSRKTTEAPNLGGAKGAVDHWRFVYDAPFFTAWLLTMSTIFFYPLHQITVRFCSCMGRKGPKTMSTAVSDAVQGFRERGMTLFQFLGRCLALCLLWLMTNYLLLQSLRVLRATEVLALYATTTSFAYLLSWVILHQQFVGLRIMAVILSNMGIALLAYMDGQSHKSPTVGYVILGACAAGSAAVFKVSLKKSFGFGATVSQQVALIFSVIGLLSAVLLWPIFLTLYFTGVEIIRWASAPWTLIAQAVFSSLLIAMLDNFGVTCTFEFFITIGLLLAIPVSAVLDVQLYGATFYEMRLAGIITVSIGFCVVLLPENWPDYITRCIRYLAQLKHKSRWGKRRHGKNSEHDPIDTRTGHIRSHLRSPSGRVR